MNNIFKGLVKGAVDTLNQRITASSAAEAEYIAEAKKRAADTEQEKEIYSYRKNKDLEMEKQALAYKAEVDKQTMRRQLGMEKDKYIAANTATDNPLAEITLAEEIPDTFTPAEATTEAPATKTGGESFSSFGAIKKKIEPSVQPLVEPKAYNVDGLSPEQLAELRNDVEAGVPIEQFNAKRKMFIDQNFRRSLEGDKIAGRIDVQELKGKQNKEAASIKPQRIEYAKKYIQENNLDESALTYFDASTKEEYLKDKENALKPYDDVDAISARNTRGAAVSKIDRMIDIARESPEKFGGMSLASISLDLAARFDDGTATFATFMKEIGLGGKEALNYTGPMSNYENQFFVDLYASFKKGAKANIEQLKMLKEIMLRKDDITSKREEYLRKGVPDPSQIDRLIMEYNKAIPYQIRGKNGKPTILSVKSGAPTFDQWLKTPKDKRPSYAKYGLDAPEVGEGIPQKSAQAPEVEDIDAQLKAIDEQLKSMGQ